LKDTSEEFRASATANFGQRGHCLIGGGRVEWRQAGETLDQRLDRRGIAKESERKCRHDAHRRVRLLEESEQQWGGPQVPDPTRRKRRDPPDDRIRRHQRALEEIRAPLARIFCGQHRSELLDDGFLLAPRQ
jgi:hypothetical protein